MLVDRLFRRGQRAVENKFVYRLSLKRGRTLNGALGIAVET